MRNSFITIIFILFCLLSVSYAEIPFSEKEALIDIFNKTGGDQWIKSETWKQEPDHVCSWEGVGCNPEQTHVIQLDLSFKGVTGNIPSSIANLSFLESLIFNDNKIESLPNEIEQLQNVKQINMGQNKLHEFPAGIVKLVNLTSLDLGLNQLEHLPIEIENLTHLVYLKLNGTLLKGIPPSIGKLINLEKLYLHENMIDHLPFEIGRLTKLTEFTINNNVLKELPPGISNFKLLTELNLEENQLEKLPMGIGDLVNIVTLKANNNLLTEIPSEISKLKNLTYLKLSQNKLTSLPSQIGELSKLTYLYLDFNMLTSIPSNIGHLLQLEELALSVNNLDSLPQEIGQMTNLISLTLSKNALNTIPSGIGTLTKLENLIINDNLITTLPSEIGNLNHLKILNLERNHLEILPSELSYLKSLTDLTLNDNPLKSIPEGIGNLTNLITLNLSNCELNNLPNDFVGLVKCQYLNLNSNALFKLPENFSHMINLKKLYLTDNQLHFLPEDFGELPTIQELIIKNNNIEYLPNNFGKLETLQYLDLSQNNIEALSDGFGDLENLEELDLSSNHLNEIPDGFTKLYNLHTLILSDNNLLFIPNHFGNLRFLTYLDLSHNHIRVLTNDLSHLYNLSFFDISNNDLVELFSDFKDLNRLYTLNLSNNQLTNLPKTFGGLKNLRVLNLSNMNIDSKGTFMAFPEEILELSILNSLDLSNNPDMADEIPILFSNLTKLNDLHIQGTPLHTSSPILIDFINKRTRFTTMVIDDVKTIPDSESLIITGVTSQSDKAGIFNSSDYIDIMIIFNRPVTLGDGDLILTLDTGNTTTISPFDYYTTTVIGRYYIHDGDNSDDLNLISITSNGGVVKDETGQSANLSLPDGANLSDNRTLAVDGEPPNLAITYPSDVSCYKNLDKIKGTVTDFSGVASMILYASDGTKTSNKINLVCAEAWAVDTLTIDWHTEEPEPLTNGQISPIDDSEPITSAWAEGVSYTIFVEAEDYAGNIANTQTSFTFGTQKSTITCNLSDIQLTIGEPLTITGIISPSGNLIHAGVSIELKSDSGSIIYRNKTVNEEGRFEYKTECDDIHFSGIWTIKTRWDGNDCLREAESESVTVQYERAKTEIVLNSTIDAIRKGDLITISGKLTPEFDCGADLSGNQVILNIIDHEKTTTLNIPININDQFGHFKLRDYNLFNNSSSQDIYENCLVYALLPQNSKYELSSSEVMTLKVLESAGYAIIVQGKVHNNEGLASHQKTADFVYTQLIQRGLLDDSEDDDLNDIQYFSYAEPGSSSYTYIDNQPSKERIKEAITVWAKNKMNKHPANLYIVFIDHGLENEFLIDEESIYAYELDQWLDTLQKGLENRAMDQDIINILGFCHSGSFIDELSGYKRIIITSAAANEFSYKGPLDDDNIREGEYFISEFFKKIALGETIKTSFEEAVILTEKFTSSVSNKSANAPYYDNSPQHPLLDDNGDGIGTNSVDSAGSDGKLSNSMVIGVSSLTHNSTGNVALLEVTDTLFLDFGDSFPEDCFWAKVDDNQRLLNLWIEIKTPSYSINSSNTGQSELVLPKIVEHGYNSALKRYEWTWDDIAVHVDFSEPGIYQIFYFAKDKDTGNVSEFMESIVYKNIKDNSSPLPFSLITPINQTQLSTKGVLFDCAYDSDPGCYTLLSWEETTDPDKDQISYSLLLSKNDISFSTPDNLITYERLLNNSMEIDMPDDWDESIIYWKVLAIDSYGAIQESMVHEFSTVNYYNPPTGTLKGYVYDSFNNQGIYRADVILETTSMRTSSRGYYHGAVKPSTYTLSVTAFGYETKYIHSVTVPSGETVEQDISMQPITIIGDINYDFEISIMDLIAGLQLLAKIETQEILNVDSDVNSDNQVGIAEVIYLINYIADN